MTSALCALARTLSHKFNIFNGSISRDNRLQQLQLRLNPGSIFVKGYQFDLPYSCLNHIMMDTLRMTIQIVSFVSLCVKNVSTLKACPTINRFTTNLQPSYCVRAVENNSSPCPTIHKTVCSNGVELGKETSPKAQFERLVSKLIGGLVLLLMRLHLAD